TFTYLQAVINFRMGIRNNRPLLISAAQRIFAPIWSGQYSNQHQGLSAILEKVNKYLKALISPLHHKIFNIIGHVDNELLGGQICPDYTLELQRFWVHLRKTG
ncbi:7922_t:CDS:2, partial [Racocetra persica]